MIKSIITSDFEHCYLCGSTHWIEILHIFGEANRSSSTKYGLVVPLCHYCQNEPPNGVHFDKKRMDQLKAIAQAKFKKFYPDIDFTSIFHRNYLKRS